jgi:hypothetical protein
MSDPIAFLQRLLDTPPAERPKLLLTVSQAADVVGISERTARDLIKNGAFPTKESPVPTEHMGRQLCIPTIKLLVALGWPLDLGDQAA